MALNLQFQLFSKPPQLLDKSVNYLEPRLLAKYILPTALGMYLAKSLGSR